MALPSLIVFDLDFTLWDCGGLWIDCTSPPFRKNAERTVVDSEGRPFRLYPDVPALLDEIDALGIPMALASRTTQPDWAREVLGLMGIRSRFHFEEIYPTGKRKHLEAIARNSGVSVREMLFFDDEERNIVDVAALGTTAIHVRSGMTFEVYERGVAAFSTFENS